MTGTNLFKSYGTPAIWPRRSSRALLAGCARRHLVSRRGTGDDADRHAAFQGAGDTSEEAHPKGPFALPEHVEAKDLQDARAAARSEDRPKASLPIRVSRTPRAARLGGASRLRRARQRPRMNRLTRGDEDRGRPQRRLVEGSACNNYSHEAACRDAYSAQFEVVSPLVTRRALGDGDDANASAAIGGARRVPTFNKE